MLKKHFINYNPNAAVLDRSTRVSRMKCSRTRIAYHAKCARGSTTMSYCVYRYERADKCARTDGCSTLHKRAQVRFKSGFPSEKAPLLHRSLQRTSWNSLHLKQPPSRFFSFNETVSGSCSQIFWGYHKSNVIEYCDSYANQYMIH